MATAVLIIKVIVALAWITVLFMRPKTKAQWMFFEAATQVALYGACLLGLRWIWLNYHHSHPY